MGQTGTSLAPRSSSNGGTNNLPPILFHQVHGDNIRISPEGSVARRVESFCKAISFSSRPIKVNEKVCVKFLEVSNNWSGVIRFGFTSNDPSSLRCSLPKYACPDLTNKPGYWAKALSERFAERDTVLFYYVTQAGDVHFGINGEEKGIFLAGIETRGPLWALFDVYGNSTAIELVDHRINVYNSRRHINGNSTDVSPEMETHILPALQSLCINQNNQAIHREDPAHVPVISKYQQPGTYIHPLPFHRTIGHNIRLSNDRSIATRNETEFCHGYVFTTRPINLGERLVVQIITTESMFVGALAFGLTSCDPATLQSPDLPEDSDSLLDRPEYWVVNKDVANTPEPGDELTFTVQHNGQVQMSKNGGAPTVFMHVDQSLQLWAFFDVYGSTQKIRLLGSIPGPQSPQTARQDRLRVALPCSEYAPVPVNNVNAQRYCCPPSNTGVQLPPALNGGTVLVVNLPPAHSNFINQQQTARHSPPHHHRSQSAHCSQAPATTGTMMSTYSNTYIEPISASSYSTLDSSVQQWAETANTGAGSECSICYERPIDSVLYMCGHMCMCFDCAVQQWRGKGGGHCPLCRATIRDVIRTYKS